MEILVHDTRTTNSANIFIIKRRFVQHKCFIFVALNVIRTKTVLIVESSVTRTPKHAFLVFTEIDISLTNPSSDYTSRKTYETKGAFIYRRQSVTRRIKDAYIFTCYSKSPTKGVVLNIPK